MKEKEGTIFTPQYLGQYRTDNPKSYTAKYVDEEGTEHEEIITKHNYEVHGQDQNFFDSCLCKDYGYHKYEFQHDYKKYFMWAQNDIAARDEIYSLLKYNPYNRNVHRCLQYEYDNELVSQRRNYYTPNEVFNPIKHNPVEIVFTPNNYNAHNVWRYVDHRLFLLNQPEEGTFDYDLKMTACKEIKPAMNKMVNIMIGALGNAKRFENNYWR